MFSRSTLTRYLIKQNVFYMLICMGVGTVIYLLSDMFDRLDDFLEAGLGVGTVLSYFFYKIPLILSQIMPAVFLIALVVQLSLMERTRELLALRAGGVPFTRLVRFFILYAIVWSFVQLAFSQAIGIYGENAAGRIWAEQVRDRQYKKEVISDVWFKSGQYIVNLSKCRPAQNTAEGITAWKLNEDSGTVITITTAATAAAQKETWLLRNAETFKPETFARTTAERLELPIEQDLKAFQEIGPGTEPSRLAVWQLSNIIEQLEKSGSNVEGLKTTLHSKWAYAFSILTMAFLALAVSSLALNIYFGLTLSLVITFIFYGVTVLGTTAGQNGLLPPFLGAWLGNILFSLLSIARITWTNTGKT